MDEITMMRCIERMTEAFGILKRKVEKLESELEEIRKSKKEISRKGCVLKIVTDNHCQKEI